MSDHNPYHPPQDVTLHATSPPPGVARSRRVAITLLILLAAAAQAAWLGEVLMHGWAGLTWLSYFHWAVPIALVGMIAWLVWMAALPAHRAAPYAVALAGFAVAGCFAFQWALFCFFDTGSIGIPLVLTDPWGSASRLAILPLLLLTAPACFAIVHQFTGKPTLRWVAIGTGLFVLSPLLGLMAMTLTTPFGGLVHVMKTGAAIPGFILALGLPCALSTKKAARVGRLS